MLLRSWLALRGRRVVNVPEDVESLIESVYDDSLDPPAGLDGSVLEMWHASHAAMLRQREKDRAEAAMRFIPRPPHS